MWVIFYLFQEILTKQEYIPVGMHSCYRTGGSA